MSTARGRGRPGIEQGPLPEGGLATAAGNDRKAYLLAWVWVVRYPAGLPRGQVWTGSPVSAQWR